MSDNHSFVTTAIPYVNGAPHLGHAFELVLADAIARHRRRLGQQVRLQSGSDDNSLKSVRAALARGIGPAELVRTNAASFEELSGLLDVELSDFIRTSSDPRHAPAVQRLWQTCDRAGDIYRREYSGRYCVGCEQFYAERELASGACPEHLAPLEWISETNYFFRASRHTAAIRRAIEENRLRILPESRRQETLRVLDEGLRDFSISRSKARAHGWGIDVPGDGEQVVFVWFDALCNYISALDYASDGAALQRYWFDSERRTHVIGKGVLRFHALYWPAILLSAGLPLPSEILVHGYVTCDGTKIGKSLGNAGDARDLVRRHGSDVFRYFALTHLHTTADSDFSEQRLLAVKHAELADQLGNLLQRTLALVLRHEGGLIPTPGVADATGQGLEQAAERAFTEQCRAFEAFELNRAGQAALGFVAEANRYTDLCAPWRLARTGRRTELAGVLYQLLTALCHAAWLLEPIIPTAAAEIRRRVGADESSGLDRTGRLVWHRLSPGTPTQPGDPLFPKTTE